MEKLDRTLDKDASENLLRWNFHLGSSHIDDLRVFHAGNLEVKAGAERASFLQAAQPEDDGSLVLSHHLELAAVRTRRGNVRAHLEANQQGKRKC